MNQSFAIKLAGILLFAVSLLFYQTVASAREQVADERNQMIAQVEAYNAEILAAESGGETSVDSADWQDGTYQGSGVGFGGTITLSVTVADGGIAGIEVVDSSSEDEAYFVQAETLLDDIVNTQSTQVDTVSGATFSSKGLIAAVQDALGKAVA